jgi:hypothetical protein
MDVISLNLSRLVVGMELLKGGRYISLSRITLLGRNQELKLPIDQISLLEPIPIPATQSHTCTTSTRSPYILLRVFGRRLMFMLDRSGSFQFSNLINHLLYKR